MTNECKSLIKHLYREVLINKHEIKSLFIVSNNKRFLDIDRGFFRYTEKEKKLCPPYEYEYYCTLREYLLAEGNFVFVAKENK